MVPGYAPAMRMSSVCRRGWGPWRSAACPDALVMWVKSPKGWPAAEEAGCPTGGAPLRNADDPDPASAAILTSSAAKYPGSPTPYAWPA